MLLIKKLGAATANSIKIDWENPRVICIAESYTKFDLDTVEVIPMRIELFKYRLYEKGLFSLESLNTSEKKTAKAKVRKSSVENIAIKETHVEALGDLKEIFEELRSRILQIDEGVTEKETNWYTAYRASKNFAEVYVGKKALKLFLRPVDYFDPENRVEKIPDSYNWAMNRRVYLKKIEEIDYILKLVKQSYKDVI